MNEHSEREVIGLQYLGDDGVIGRRPGSGEQLQLAPGSARRLAHRVD